MLYFTSIYGIIEPLIKEKVFQTSDAEVITISPRAEGKKLYSCNKRVVGLNGGVNMFLDDLFASRYSHHTKNSAHIRSPSYKNKKEGKTMNIKRTLAFLLCISIMVGLMPMYAFATTPTDESEPPAETIDAALEETNTLGEVGGYLSGNMLNTASLYRDRKFTQSRGFGFAAENGNNLIDRLHGVNATVVGDNNAANGPDRLIVNRKGNTLIQTKYHHTASASVADAFDLQTGLYRYMDSNGKPMQLEVPKDQFDEAVKLMRAKIENGKVPGVTNPEDASKIVRKGHLNFQQAKNIAKAGNIDSLKYDAANGIVSASCAAGISFVIDYVCCVMNGMESEDALKNAGLNGIKTGGVVFATYVISSQLAKTGMAQSFSNALVPTAEAILKTFGDDVGKAILQGAGIQTAGKVTAKQVSNALARELVVDGVLVIILTGADVVDLFRGRISKEEVLKNLTVTIISVAVGAAGGYGGALAGNLIAPGAGGVIGSVAGAILAGGLSALGAEALIAPFYESDAEEMFNIISEEFTILCGEYLIDEEEGSRIAESLKGVLVGDVLKDMYASENRNQFARELIEPLFVNETVQRSAIVVPTTEELRYHIKQMLQGIVFIH